MSFYTDIRQTAFSSSHVESIMHVTHTRQLGCVHEVRLNQVFLKTRFDDEVWRGSWKHLGSNLISVTGLTCQRGLQQCSSAASRLKGQTKLLRVHLSCKHGTATCLTGPHWGATCSLYPQSRHRMLSVSHEQPDHLGISIRKSVLHINPGLN